MATPEAETRQRLLRNVKKEVKQIMEEAVTRKFVHEDSSHIVSFCAAVEACVLHGLKRRAAGFLRSNKVAALFTKVGKSLPLAEELCRKAQDLEQLLDSKRSQTVSCDNSRKLPRLSGPSPQAVRHLWIRTALIEKVLDKIVLYLVENSSRFYEKDAVLMDPVDGPILASLLVGPCALEYTKMKTADHFWTDPSADELVQRHRIHSSHFRQDSPTKRPALCIQKRHSSSSMDERPSPSPSARDYVESLHQNSRATLLFGKNNVLVQPKDDMEAIPGYLSLHQTAEVMTLKWTPNQLMNGSMGDLDYEKSVFWDYAMTIHLEEIVYLHCHQQVDSGGTVVLVSQDGTQRPPLRFPCGGHLLQFLSCLENGLLPRGQLDPPLWSQRGKGKVFPKLRKKGPQGSTDSTSDREEDEAADYVFRIIFPNSQSEFVTVPQSSHPPGGATLLSRSLSLFPSRRQQGHRLQTTVVPKRCISCPTAPPSPAGSPVGPSAPPAPPSPVPELIDQGPDLWQPLSKTSSCFQCSFSDGAPSRGCVHERAPLKLLCDNMKYQIISRAFYGWLAYCRHLSTVRTHLSALVNHTIVEPDVPCDASGGLTEEEWRRLLQDCSESEEQEVLRLVYFGGVEPSLRKEVWPFLLGHYRFGMTEAERKEVDERGQAFYEQTMQEWQGCEAVVREREREQHAAALAKCSSASSGDTGGRRTLHRDSTVSNESSQSCSSDRQRDARLQSDSSSSTQVFESVEEVEQMEAEPKPAPKVSNGASPDSGHPSSRNFSMASCLSDSLSVEDSSAHEASGRSVGRETGAGGERGVAEDDGTEMREEVEVADAGGEGRRGAGGRSPLGATCTPAGEERGVAGGGAAPETEGGASEAADAGPGTKTERESNGQGVGGETRGREDAELSEVTGADTSSADQGAEGKRGGTGEIPPDSRTAVEIRSDLRPKMEGARGVGKEAEPKIQSPAWTKGTPAEAGLGRVEGRGMEGRRAPVVRETVVPAVFEASRTRRMSGTRPVPPTADSDESPPAIEMEEIPMAWNPAPASVPPASRDPALREKPEMESLYPEFADLAVGGEKNDAMATTYSAELLDLYTLNLHRIDKDVQRCDRTYGYFTPANLEKLRNIMCSYIWRHLQIGYVQGMCDLLAPLLVILDDEALAFSCFTELMKRMNQNFPHGGEMDTHFANMRSLIQILDSELFELMHQNGDYTHFYFCYRWFLLDFKRELVYDDVFAVWETIWAAKHASSGHFVLFIALALVEIYRDIILENNMDFTDIIKFFNEMAEHHDVKQLLALARDLVCKVQRLIENK
ncbi:small G protein signaling modulator 1 isoform X2 [Brachyhypopomus gauderio]|uniref:small G protein signaling modulator 1 isoform X2 n=1 Tax=Brachyhypopomus gauderio TaxID=698409 RepID=UPI004040FE08